MEMKKASLREKAYIYIKEKIVQCEFLPGSPLYDKDLMAAIGAGRTPIREALLKLAEEQFVRINPKRGIFVTEISVQDVMDVYILREVVEPAAARIAAEVMDMKILEPFRLFWSDRNIKKSAAEHVMKDREFHRAIADSTKNKYFIQTLFTLYDQVNRVRFFTLNQSSERIEQVRKEHLLIIQKLRKRDAAGSEQAMREHLNRAKETARMLFPNFIMR